MKRLWGFWKPRPRALASNWGKEPKAILLIEERSDGPVVSIGKGAGTDVEWFSTHGFPDSPGCLAHAFVCYLRQSGPDELARLATYANPESATFFHFYELIQERLVRMDADGNMSLDKKYFYRKKGLLLPNENEWWSLFKLAPSQHGELLTQGHFDLALAAQRVVEDLVFALAGTAGRLSGSRQLCLAGQQVITPPVVGTLAQTGLFDHIHFEPKGDTPAITPADLPLIDRTAAMLAEGKTVGWKDKYLLADPRKKGLKEPMEALALAPEAATILDMKERPPAKRLSLKLLDTHRRPVPSRYFGWSRQDKTDFEKSAFPAVTHADFSVWAAFPDPLEDPVEYKLVKAFFEATGCPMLGFESK